MPLTHNDIFRIHIPHRLGGVAAFGDALRLRTLHGAPRITVCAEGRVIMVGNLNAYTNAAIEAGLMHCRALLEFLGLREGGGKLIPVRFPRRETDVGVEQLGDPASPLAMVEPAAAVRHPGYDPSEVEAAIVYILRTANKELAHSATEFEEHPERLKYALVAAEIIPKLVVNFLYRPLGLPTPNYEIERVSRPT